MRTVYVLMYWSDEGRIMDVSTGETSPPKRRPYAVFEDSITAEKMKRDGDEIVAVPYFEDKPDRSNLYTATPNSINVIPCNDHTTVTYQSSPWSKDSTLTPPDYEPFPRVTCNKTIDEHNWTNRVD